MRRRGFLLHPGGARRSSSSSSSSSSSPLPRPLKRLLSVALALAVFLSSDSGGGRAHAAYHTGVQQEERLIGWLGEVPRPQHASSSNPSSDPDNHNDNPGSGIPSAAAGFPEHDASGLDTDFIGVGNPNVEKLSDDPKAYLYRGFLSAEEAAHLIEIGQPHMKRSTVVGGKSETGEDNGLTDNVRTSHGTFIPKEYDDVVFSVEKRVEQYSQISYENQEQLQLLRYYVGQEYKDHMDGLLSENGKERETSDGRPSSIPIELSIPTFPFTPPRLNPPPSLRQ